MISRCQAGLLLNSQSSAGFVDHAGDLDITAQGQPSDTIFGVTDLAFEDRKPGIEEEVELLHPGFEDAGGDEVSEFM